MSGTVPYGRLGSFYFFHYAALGALVPYWSLYMTGRGFGAVEIGLVMAIILAGRVVAPTLWGWVADRRGNPRVTLLGASAVALMAFLVLPALPGFLWLAVVMAVFSTGHSGVIPQFEATTLNHLGLRPERYGLVRVWGSLGFIVAVWATGLLFDYRPVSWLPWVVSSLLTMMLISIWITPVSAPARVAEAGGSLKAALLQPGIPALLAACFLVQASFGPYYVFFTVYLETLGYSTARIGLLWALAVASEIMVFLMAGWLLSRFRLRRLFQLAVGLGVLRWTVTGALALQPLALIAAQVTHMATFGLYHAVAVALIHRHFTGRLQVRGQALYSSTSFGAGGVAGSLLAGFAWQHLGAAVTYYLAAGIAALAFLITLTGMRSLSGPEAGEIH